MPNVLTNIVIEYLSDKTETYLSDIEDGKLLYQKIKIFYFCYLNTRINYCMDRLFYFVDDVDNSYSLDFILVGWELHPITYIECGKNYHEIQFEQEDNSYIRLNTNGEFLVTKLFLETKKFIPIISYFQKVIIKLFSMRHHSELFG